MFSILLAYSEKNPGWNPHASKGKRLPVFYIPVISLYKGWRQKKQTVYLKTLSKYEGGRSTPCQKFEKKWIFDKSWRGRGSHNILSKIEALYFVLFITLSIPLYPRSTLFCMINYSVCTPDPQKVIGIIDNVNFKA